MLVGGRMKPLDTVARNSLLIIQGKQELPRRPEGPSAMQWLTDVVNAPLPINTNCSPCKTQTSSLSFGWQHNDRKYFSMAEFSPFLS